MMKLAKDTQERFQRELKELEQEEREEDEQQLKSEPFKAGDLDDKNDEEDADLFTDEELERLEKKHGSKLNKDFYNDELTPSKPDPIVDHLINIDRSLTIIADSTRTIARYLEDKEL